MSIQYCNTCTKGMELLSFMTLLSSFVHFPNIPCVYLQTATLILFYAAVAKVSWCYWASFEHRSPIQVRPTLLQCLPWSSSMYDKWRKVILVIGCVLWCLIHVLQVFLKWLYDYVDKHCLVSSFTEITSLQGGRMYIFNK